MLSKQTTGEGRKRLSEVHTKSDSAGINNLFLLLLLLNRLSGVALPSMPTSSSATNRHPFPPCRNRVGFALPRGPHHLHQGVSLPRAATAALRVSSSAHPSLHDRIDKCIQPASEGCPRESA